MNLTKRSNIMFLVAILHFILACIVTLFSDSYMYYALLMIGWINFIGGQIVATLEENKQ